MDGENNTHRPAESLSTPIRNITLIKRKSAQKDLQAAAKARENYPKKIGGFKIEVRKHWNHYAISGQVTIK